MIRNLNTRKVLALSPEHTPDGDLWTSAKLPALGEAFGSLTYRGQPGRSNEPSRKTLTAEFECACGTSRRMKIREVVAGRIVSCGCARHAKGLQSGVYEMLSSAPKTANVPAIGEVVSGFTFNGKLCRMRSKTTGQPYLAGEWICKCGNTTVQVLANIRSGKVLSCGCSRKAKNNAPEQDIDVSKLSESVELPAIGEKIGNFTFNGKVSRVRDGGTGKLRLMAELICQCGTVTRKVLSKARSGAVKSCGCMKAGRVKAMAPELPAKADVSHIKAAGRAKVPDIGERFSSLVFIGGVTSAPDGITTQGIFGVFRCDCGSERLMSVTRVRCGYKSCGCVRSAKKAVENDATDSISWKPSRPGARLIRARHNTDAMPARAAISIGSGANI